MLNPRLHHSLNFFLITVRICFQKAHFYTQIDFNSQTNFLNQLTPLPHFCTLRFDNNRYYNTHTRETQKILAWKGANFENSTRNKIVALCEINQFCPRIWARCPICEPILSTAPVQILNNEYKMSYGMLALKFEGDEAVRFLYLIGDVFIKTVSSF